jgi:hypothetical protein
MNPINLGLPRMGVSMGSMGPLPIIKIAFLRFPMYKREKRIKKLTA